MFPPPPVQGLGTLGGFKLQVEDRADRARTRCTRRRRTSSAKARAEARAGRRVLQLTRSTCRSSIADVDRVKAKQLGVQLSDVFETLQVYLGSLYVNDFNRFGRTYQVMAQADAPFRSQREDIAAAEDAQRERRDGAAGRR